VSLRHSRIHAEDCADCETRAGLLDRIERVIRLDGNLDDRQRARLLEIANRCPVHRTLRSEIVIDTTPSSVSAGMAAQPPLAMAAAMIGNARPEEASRT
jgi:putative redox protein